MGQYLREKEIFSRKLSAFANQICGFISQNDEWTIKGFIDIFKNVYSISSDTKIVSKLLEIHLFPYFLLFAQDNGYILELATHQNYYPDLTFISINNSKIKFAVDLKTTYRLEGNDRFCNGFTLGSHGEYFVNRNSTKNIQYPYNEYSGHFCLGIIYSRNVIDKTTELTKYSIDNLKQIPSVIGHFTFFAQEKWRIASDKGGSGNTANIGSIRCINDILNGNGTFSKAGEEIFDDYWANYGKLQIVGKDGQRKPLSSFEEYVKYRGLPDEIIPPKASTRKEK